MITQILLMNLYELEKPVGFREKEYMIYLLMVLPLLEELAFRLPLNLNKWYFRISGVLLMAFVIALATRRYDIDLELAFIPGLMVLAILTFYSFYFKHNRLTRLVVFNSSALLFAILHFWNFQEMPFPAYLFIFIPHFAAGIIYGCFRLKFGFWYGVLLHYLINLLPFLVILSRSNL